MSAFEVVPRSMLSVAPSVLGVIGSGAKTIDSASSGTPNSSTQSTASSTDSECDITTNPCGPLSSISLPNSSVIGIPTGINNGNYSLNTSCNLCHETLNNPKVLSCLHTFCQLCLERIVSSSGDNGFPVSSDPADLSSPLDLSSNHISCPTCNGTTYLPEGISALSTDFAVANVLESLAIESCKNKKKDSQLANCTGCKGTSRSGAVAVARCFNCANLLCTHCAMAHQYMHCFEGHRVTQLTDIQKTASNSAGHSNGHPIPATPAEDKVVQCRYHRNYQLSFYCRGCDTPICKECTLVEHKCHDYEFLSTNTQPRLGELVDLNDKVKDKIAKMSELTKVVESSSTRIAMMYHKAEGDINDTYNFYRSMIDERKSDALKELDQVFGARQLILTNSSQKLASCVDSLLNGATFIDKLLQHASPVESLLFKRSLDSRLSNLLMRTPDDCQQAFGVFNNIEFISNFQAIQVGVKNTFGYIRPIANSNDLMATETQFNIQNEMMNNFSRQNATAPTTEQLHNLLIQPNHTSDVSSSFDQYRVDALLSSEPPSSSSAASSLVNAPVSCCSSKMSSNGGSFLGVNAYERWSGNGSGASSITSSNPGHMDIYQNSAHSSTDSSMCVSNPTMDVFSTANTGGSTGSVDSISDLTNKMISANVYPPKSQLRRLKMIYHCKFGEFGVMEGQFTEPSGVAVNAQNDIVVADTNNHRIQIFDKEGRFKFQFGECGKRDGQLLYPNRVAVVRSSGDIVVTERSPTHQVQLYNQYGQFVRKFGSSILQHPRGVTVDSRGRIIIIECKVMRVIIFDQMGSVLSKFSCSKHLEFPNGVVVNDRDEIFISDNRAHCVKVFSYTGIYLRQIGSEGVTNYPIGVGISYTTGDILIADNHNNFNLTTFSQDGRLQTALESKVKHAQCFDVALMDDGSIVLASKDYRLYIYRYALQMANIANSQENKQSNSSNGGTPYNSVM